MQLYRILKRYGGCDWEVVRRNRDADFVRNFISVMVTPGGVHNLDSLVGYYYNVDGRKISFKAEPEN